MLNGYSRGPSFEPGAFGGAWTLATCVEFAAEGIDRVFHWNIGAGVGGYDPASSLDAAGHMLYFGNAWVMAAARKLFGGSKAANTISVLQAAPSPSTSVATVDTLARRSEEEVGDVCAKEDSRSAYTQLELDVPSDKPALHM